MRVSFRFFSDTGCALFKSCIFYLSVLCAAKEGTLRRLRIKDTSSGPSLQGKRAVCAAFIPCCAREGPLTRKNIFNALCPLFCKGRDTKKAAKGLSLKRKGVSLQGKRAVCAAFIRKEKQKPFLFGY